MKERKNPLCYGISFMSNWCLQMRTTCCIPNTQAVISISGSCFSCSQSEAGKTQLWEEVMKLTDNCSRYLAIYFLRLVLLAIKNEFQVFRMDSTVTLFV